MAKKAQKPPRKALNDAEKYYIAYNPDDLTDEQLAAKLQCTLKTVKYHKSKNKPEKEKVEEEFKGDVSEPVQTHIDTLMGKKTDGGRSVSVMTPAASEYLDATRERRQSQQLNQDHIKKIR